MAKNLPNMKKKFLLYAIFLFKLLKISMLILEQEKLCNTCFLFYKALHLKSFFFFSFFIVLFLCIFLYGLFLNVSETFSYKRRKIDFLLSEISKKLLKKERKNLYHWFYNIHFSNTNALLDAFNDLLNGFYCSPLQFHCFCSEAFLLLKNQSVKNKELVLVQQFYGV